MGVPAVGLDTMIGGKVIGGGRLGGRSGRLDLAIEFTWRYKSGECSAVRGWLLDAKTLCERAKWMM